MPIYTQSALRSDVNARIKGKIGVLVDAQSTINQGVREVLSDLDLITTRRRTPLVPNLYAGLFEYAAPTDLKAYSVITIQNQLNTPAIPWGLVPYEQFMRRQDGNTIGISHYDGVKKIYLNTSGSVYYYNYCNNGDYNFGSTSLAPNARTTIAGLDTLSSGGGTWSAFGFVTPGEVYKDESNFVEGSGSIRFNINAASGTTAGIVNSTLNSSDMSTYFSQNGSAYVWAFITSITNITNFKLILGSNSSNFNSMTATTQSDGTAFVNGWNLIAFDLSTASLTGTPVNTAITYSAIYMTKTTAKVSETAYRFDFLVLRRGQVNNLYYYSSYGWQSSVGAYKVNSTSASDLLNADEDEYQLILAKCSELAALEVDEDRAADSNALRYRELKKYYKMNNPSEALIMISTITDFVKL